VVVLEHVLEQEHRSLVRRELREQHEKRQRDRFGSLQPDLRAVNLTGEDRLGEPGSDVLFARAAFKRSRQSRVTMVVANAFGDRIVEAAAPR
jgi:hypothetical protein